MTNQEKRLMLSPCPFCGNEGVYWFATLDADNIPKFVVICGECSANVEEDSAKAAEDAWNRRPGDVRRDPDDAPRHLSVRGGDKSKIVQVNVDSASYDEPVRHRVELTSRVERAIARMRDAQNFASDGTVFTVPINFEEPTITEEEFLEWVANDIGRNEDEVESLMREFLK